MGRGARVAKQPRRLPWGSTATTTCIPEPPMVITASAAPSRHKA